MTITGGRTDFLADTAEPFAPHALPITRYLRLCCALIVLSVLTTPAPVSALSTCGNSHTRYWVLDGGTWSDSAHWACSSGGPGGAAPPTDTDDCILDANSFTLANQVVVQDLSSTCRSMSWTQVQGNPTLQLEPDTNTLSLNGSLALSAAMNISVVGQDASTAVLDFNGQKGSYNITLAGHVFAELDLDEFVGQTDTSTWTLNDDIDLSGAGGLGLQLYWGATLVTGGHNVTATDVGINDGATLTASTSTFDLVGDGEWGLSSHATATVAGATIHQNICGDFYGGGGNYGTVALRACAGTHAVHDSSTFAALILDAGAAATFDSTTNQHITTLTATGTTLAPIGINADTAGQQATLTLGTPFAGDHLAVQDIDCEGSTPCDAGSYSTDLGDNLHWLFRIAPCRDDVDGSGRPATVTDTVYISRALLGLPPVPVAFRSLDPTLPADSVIAANVAALGNALDVDMNGTVDVTTDIVYIARHLLGLSPVPSNFRVLNPDIPADSVIAANIDALCP